MFDRIVAFCIQNRLLIVALSVVTLVYGGLVARNIPVDVLPDLSRPTVTIFTEAPGLSPEEVESLVIRPIESAVNGATGVTLLRSTASAGLGLVFVEFDWDQDIHLARQIVTERLSEARARLPSGVETTLGPISSIMGNIMIIGVTSDDAATDAMALRSLAEWDLRPRLLAVPGVSQVTLMGGELRQFQVLVKADKLLLFQLSLQQVLDAVEASNRNSSGGYLIGPYREGQVRVFGRVGATQDLSSIVVRAIGGNGGAITLGQIAEIREAGPIDRRGDASVNGQKAVILSVQKQPGANTLAVVDQIRAELAALRGAVPDGVQLHDDIFSQADFIDAAVNNVEEALRDGAIIITIILFLFLLNLRTTFITLAALPLSLVVTFLVFSALELSINTMTLGGIAIAIGELVDDAIVGVENVYRRLRQNRAAPSPKPAFLIVLTSTLEVRRSIVFSTIIVVLVFLPLFALSGIEGRLFTALGLAYIISILASLIVSLTVTPALCAWLLPTMKQVAQPKDGVLVRSIKSLQATVIRLLLPLRFAVMATAFVLFVGALALASTFGQSFLPEFNEGSVNVGLTLPPGTSMEESNRMAAKAEAIALALPEVDKVGRRTGRAEQDDHAEPPNVSELEFTLHERDRPRAEAIAELRENLRQLPGVAINIGQPLSHRIDHMLSGVRAQIAIKIFGRDLDEMREVAARVAEQAAGVQGVVDAGVEQQVMVPQVHVRIDRAAALRHGLDVGSIASTAEAAIGGRVAGEVIDGIRSYDIVVRLVEEDRNSIDAIRNLPIPLPGGGFVPLSLVAAVEEAKGPNQIARENAQRRIIVQANVEGRDLVGAVDEIRERVSALDLPASMTIVYGGEYESQTAAVQTIALLSIVALVGMFLALYTHFRSINFALQVMICIPLAFIGAVVGVALTDATISLATIVGFITLTGIASRNGILMIAHYMHLMREESEPFSQAMIIRGTQERIIPVLMTALTAMLGVLPLLFATDQPGREILGPVAVVIFSGLATSTLLDLVIRPLLFWQFGRAEAMRLVADSSTESGGITLQPTSQEI
jgi:CzcA family heavy metal efflux pump